MKKTLLLATMMDWSGGYADHWGSDGGIVFYVVDNEAKENGSGGVLSPRIDEVLKTF